MCSVLIATAAGIYIGRFLLADFQAFIRVHSGAGA